MQTYYYVTPQIPADLLLCYTTNTCRFDTVTQQLPVDLLLCYTTITCRAIILVKICFRHGCKYSKKYYVHRNADDGQYKELEQEHVCQYKN